MTGCISWDAASGSYGREVFTASSVDGLPDLMQARQRVDWTSDFLNYGSV